MCGLTAKCWSTTRRCTATSAPTSTTIARVCFEIDEPGEVFDYAVFECDSSVAFKSVIVFGTIRVVEDEAAKRRFFDALMAKYGKPDSGRPKQFYPRLDDITLYAITPARITGKETPLPEVSEQWPARDHDEIAQRAASIAAPFRRLRQWCIGASDGDRKSCLFSGQ